MLRLRSLDIGVSSTGVDPVALQRELRLTLEQVPVETRQKASVLRLWMPKDSGGAWEQVLRTWCERQALVLEVIASEGHPLESGMAACVATANLVQPQTQPIEFLPEKQSRLSMVLARYNARRFTTLGIVAGSALLVLVLAFLWLEIRGWLLRSEWHSIEARVGEVREVQNSIREYRSWHDHACVNLSVLKAITDAFPDGGSVTARNIEIRGASQVVVTGTMRDNSSLLGVLEILQHNKDVSDLKVDQIRGKAPAQFTFSFKYTGGSTK